MPHNNIRPWTSPRNYGNPPSAAEAFVETSQFSLSASDTAGNTGRQDHWDTVLNPESERVPSNVMSRTSRWPSSGTEHTSTDSPNGARPSSNQTATASQLMERAKANDEDSDFMPRLPVRSPVCEVPPTPTPTATQSPAYVRPAPGLQRLSDNLTALRTFDAERQIEKRSSTNDAKVDQVNSNKASPNNQPMLPAKAIIGQHPTKLNPGYAKCSPFQYNFDLASSLPRTTEGAQPSFRFNPMAHFQPRFSLGQNGSGAQQQIQPGYSVVSAPFQAQSAVNSASARHGSGTEFDRNLQANLRQELSHYGAREVDDLTSNLGDVSLYTPALTNAVPSSRTTPPTTATSRGSNGSGGSGGRELPPGWATFAGYNDAMLAPQQTPWNSQSTLVNSSLGETSPDSDAHMPDSVFHDIAATLRARAQQHQAIGPMDYGQSARSQEQERALSYRFSDFADPSADRSLHTPQSVYVVVEFKLHRSELYQMAFGWGMGDMLGRSELFVKVEADRGYDVGMVVMATADLAEAREERMARYKKQWNTLVSFSSQAHWVGMPKTLRQEKFEGYYSHMSGQPLTSSCTGGKTPPAIVCIVAPWVIADLGYKEHAEAKAKRKCQEAARALPSLGGDCEVVGVEYQLDCQKLTAFYISNAYIEYRELAHSLYKTFKTRLWFVALNPSAIYPLTRAPSYDHRMLAPTARQHALQPGDSHFYAAPSLGSPPSLPHSSMYAGHNQNRFANAQGPRSNGTSSTMPPYISELEPFGSHSMAPYRDSRSSGFSGSRGPRFPADYEYQQNHESTASAYDGSLTLGNNTQSPPSAQSARVNMDGAFTGAVNSRSTSFGNGTSSSFGNSRSASFGTGPSVHFGNGAISASGNGVFSPSGNGVYSSSGNGAYSSFGNRAFSSSTSNGLPGLGNFGRNGYLPSTTPNVSYSQPRPQGEQNGVARDFGPIGPRNRQ